MRHMRQNSFCTFAWSGNRPLRLLLLVPAVVALSAGCAPSQPPRAADHVTVLYDTTRIPASPRPANLDKMFTGKGTENRVEQFGAVTVAVPRAEGHKVNANGIQIVEPVTIGRDGGAFLRDLDARFKAEKRPAVVYVHGFNNGFEAGAHRSALFAHELTPDTAPTPVIYSWPSAGQLFAYSHDEESVILDQDRLRGFLDGLSAATSHSGSGTANVLLVGHSLGCRALTVALRDIYRFRLARGLVRPGNPPLFEHLVFLEPDVNSEYFTQQLGEMRWLFKDITVYLRPHRDIALGASELLHGFTRIGPDAFTDLENSRWKNIPLARVDVIDASAQPSDLVGHSYDTPQLFADLRGLLAHRPARERRETLEPHLVTFQDAQGHQRTVQTYILRR